MMSTSVALIVVLLLHSSLAANYVECPDDEPCKCPNNDTCIIEPASRCTTIECPDDYSCSISCGSAGRDCQYTNIVCPSNGAHCDISCSVAACDHTNIVCPMNATGQCINTTLSGSRVETVTFSSIDDELPDLNCPYYIRQCGYTSGEYQCECEEDRWCEIDCLDRSQCYCMTINCPANYNCSILCGGSMACANMVVNCPTSTDQDVYCNFDCFGGNSCNGLYINYPENGNSPIFNTYYTCDAPWCNIGSEIKTQFQYFNECALLPTKEPTTAYPTSVDVSDEPTVNPIIASNGVRNSWKWFICVFAACFI